MNENIERVLAVLDGFRMSDEMTYSAYSTLYDEISLLDDLLKEQEPRVITPEEVKAYNGYCWFEKNNATIMCVSLIKDGQLFDFSDPPYDMKFLNWFYYGKKWRCWSAQPTDEQRKAVKWI